MKAKLRELWYAIRTSNWAGLECRWCHSTSTSPCESWCPNSEERALPPAPENGTIFYRRHDDRYGGFTTLWIADEDGPSVNSFGWRYRVESIADHPEPRVWTWGHWV